MLEDLAGIRKILEREIDCFPSLGDCQVAAIAIRCALGLEIVGGHIETKLLYGLGSVKLKHLWNFDPKTQQYVDLVCDLAFKESKAYKELGKETILIFPKDSEKYKNLYVRDKSTFSSFFRWLKNNPAYLEETFDFLSKNFPSANLEKVKGELLAPH